MNKAPCPDDIDDEDVETELLLHFLKSLEKRLKKKASNLTQSIELVDKDLKVIEGRREACKRSSAGCSELILKIKEEQLVQKGKNVLRETITSFWGNINELEDMYFSAKSKSREKEKSTVDRVDKGILTKRERLYCAQDPPSSLPAIDRIFFDGICKLGRYKKFEVCGTLKNIDILNANGVVSSLSFDCDEEYIASAGVSKKIKIFEFNSFLDDSVDIQYPVFEMSSNSKFSCVSWNKYIKNYLASTECNGLVQIWDTNTGQGVVQYNEHKKRAWSVDFSQTDPTNLLQEVMIVLLKYGISMREIRHALSCVPPMFVVFSSLHIRPTLSLSGLLNLRSTFTIFVTQDFHGAHYLAMEVLLVM